ELPFDADFDAESRLLVGGRPVATRLGADLRGTDISVVLSDEQVRVVWRHAAQPAVAQVLDDLMLAPGYRWHLAAAGTNGLGLASRCQAPVLVDGDEHFMDAVARVSMASAPITDPRTGQLLGALTLVCPAESVNALLLPVARRAAREIEFELLDNGSTRERLLDECFLRARRRTRQPLVVVGERTLLTNASASRLVGRDDRVLLWDVAERALKVGDPSAAFVALASGTLLEAAVEPVHDGDELAG